MDKLTKDMLKKTVSMLEDAKNIISSIAEETRNTFDEMSEKVQEGEKGQRLDEIATQLEEHDDALDDLINDLGDLINEE